MIILLILLIPILASAVNALLRNTRHMEFVYLLSAASSFGASVWLAAEVLQSGPVAWADSFLYADHLSALVVALTAFVYLATAPFVTADEKFVNAVGHAFPNVVWIGRWP